MKFKDIAGQITVKNRLINAAISGRVSHAQLFVGPQGCGHLPLAVAYAQYLSCTDKLPDDSCGQCPSCIKYEKLVHPDLHFAFPVATSKQIPKEPTSQQYAENWRAAFLENPYLNITQLGNALGIENKQPIINVHECNDIVRRLSLKPYESEYKMMLIWLPEKLHHAAAPKLLKILEEPPDKTVFLMVTNDQEKLLPTISSRLQAIKFNRLSNEVLTQTLNERYDISPVEINQIIRQCQGDLGLAIQLASSSADTIGLQELFLPWLRMCFAIKKAGSMLKLVDWVDDISRKGRESQKHFLHYALQVIRECMILNYGDHSLIQLSDSEFIAYEKLAPYINGSNAKAIYEELNKAFGEIERNANPKILFMSVSLKLTKLLHLKEAQPIG